MDSTPPDDSASGKQEALALVNQQLERAVEQLRRANQALAAAHDELLALGTHLEDMQYQAARMEQEISCFRDGYAGALDHVPFPTLLTDAEARISIWNGAAQRLFCLNQDCSAGMELREIPVQPSLRQILAQKHRTVAQRGSTLVLKNQPVEVKPALYRMDVHFTALRAGVLVVFRDRVAAIKEQRSMEMVGTFAS